MVQSSALRWPQKLQLPQDLEHLGQKTRWVSFSQAQRRSLTAVSPFRPLVGLMTVPHTVLRGPPT